MFVSRPNLKSLMLSIYYYLTLFRTNYTTQTKTQVVGQTIERALDSKIRMTKRTRFSRHLVLHAHDPSNFSGEKKYNEDF